ncbi:hypothetical protein ACX1DX_14620 [Tessaracoccus sp. Y36]|uniref:hypothetical protein n=1 Tax=Tessaracoccus sp. ZS01 TaxID=1906324 RepID=UPI00096D5748|nr:hypothetical protein [Tessaracoccus sp. ZS01]MCG6566819.1 hypothetical protein [Tessaracoccus sp. ZS01]OMG57959.1 hypothetical protein BJN44_04135 [Tessaracoccus sp. ZS01]
MAEIRKFDPSSGEGIQKLVREALGETVRPVAPGQPRETEEKEQEAPDQEALDAARVPGHLFFPDSGSTGGGGGSW